MKNLLWLVLAGLVVFVFLRKKAQPSGSTGSAQKTTAATSTGTQTPSQPFWSGWQTKASQIDAATTSSISQATNAINSLSSGIMGLFGDASKATGSKSPTTSGSGAGVPVDSTATQQPVQTPDDSNTDDSIGAQMDFAGAGA